MRIKVKDFIKIEKYFWYFPTIASSFPQTYVLLSDIDTVPKINKWMESEDGCKKRRKQSQLIHIFETIQCKISAAIKNHPPKSSTVFHPVVAVKTQFSFINVVLEV